MPIADELFGFGASFIMLILGAAGAWCIHGTQPSFIVWLWSHSDHFFFQLFQAHSLAQAFQSCH